MLGRGPPCEDSVEAGEIGGRNEALVSRRFCAATAANSVASRSSIDIKASELVLGAPGAGVGGNGPAGADEAPPGAAMFSLMETQLSRCVIFSPRALNDEPADGFRLCSSNCCGVVLREGSAEPLGASWS